MSIINLLKTTFNYLCKPHRENHKKKIASKRCNLSVSKDSDSSIESGGIKAKFLYSPLLNSLSQRSDPQNPSLQLPEVDVHVRIIVKPPAPAEKSPRRAEDFVSTLLTKPPKKSVSLYTPLQHRTPTLSADGL